jgi:pseudouridine-5'-phosphate glycosidase
MIGLNSEQLKRLAISGRQFQKTARRDIAHVVSALHTRNYYSFSGSALSAVLLLFTQEKGHFT